MLCDVHLWNGILLTDEVACATTKKNKPSMPKPPQLNSFLEIKGNEKKQITVTLRQGLCLICDSKSFFYLIVYLTFVVVIWPVLRR